MSAGQAPSAEAAEPPRTLIGGVGYRWLRDASFGLIAADIAAARERPPSIDVADLGYGAIYAAQDIAAAQPPYERVVLLAGVARGRAPGSLHWRRWRSEQCPPEELQERMREAGAGVIDLDHLLYIGEYFAAWPGEVLIVEFEPVEGGSGDGLSRRAEAALEEAIELALGGGLGEPAAAAGGSW